MLRRPSDRHFPALHLLVSAAIVAGSAQIAAASAVADCRLAVAGAVLRRVTAYQINIDRCLRYGAYQGCPISGDFLDASGEVLDQAIVDETSPCAEAIAQGATIGDVAPATCTGRTTYPVGNYWYGEWYFYDQCSLAIGNLSDLETCVVCQAAGIGSHIHYDLDLPYVAPESLNDRKCIRAAHSAVSRATRTGIGDAIRCAKLGGEPPWSCPLDTSPDGNFGHALAGIDKKMAKCRNNDGIQGQIGRGTAELCNATVTTPEDLSACLRRNATCQACLTINIALGQSQDCAALSGEPDCGLNPEKPIAGSFAVTNRDDNTFSLFDEEAQPAFGTLASSTFASGPAPTEVAISEKSNTVLVVNSGDDSVSAFRAATGDPVSGTLAGSTVVVGNNPVAATVNPERDFFYVANSGDDTVTFLDARDGSYAMGTLAASTFPVGSVPVSLAVDSDGNILYVANSADGTLTFLDAATGAPWFGTLAASTFAVGTEPSSIAYHEIAGGYGYVYYQTILVTDAVDGKLRSIDAFTGLPNTVLDDTNSEIDFGPSADHLVVVPGYLRIPIARSSTSPKIVSWSDYNGFQEFDVDAFPTDLALGVEDSQLGNTDTVLAGDRPLYVSFGDLDEVVVTTTDRGYRNAGESAAGLSSIKTTYNRWSYDAANARFFAIRQPVYPENGPVAGVIRESDYGVEREIDLPSWGWAAPAYDASEDTLYVATADTVIFYDPSTGLPKLGTLTASTFTCGCDAIGEIAASDAAQRIYMHCGDYIAYMDAATGACLGGSPVTTGAGGAYLSGLAIDESAGVVLTSSAGGIFRLDLTSPQYKNGTLTASTIPGSVDEPVLRTDGAGRVYSIESYPRKIAAHDIATGALVAQVTSNWEPGGDLDVDLENGIVRVTRQVYPGTYVYYLKLSDLTFLTGVEATSRLRMLYPSALLHGTDDGLLISSQHATRIRRDAVSYAVADPAIGGIVVPTGDYPAGVAVMPAHTFN